MSRLTKKIALVLSVLVLSYVGMGFVLGKSNDDKTYRALTVYSEVLQHIQRDYVDDPDMHQVTNGALHGLLDALDPQSSYLSPLEYTDYKQKMESKGKGSAGMTVSKRFGYIAVVSVMPDGPAQKAGLHNGDVLESIAGFTTSQMSVGQAQALLGGEPGVTVKMSVIRRSKPEPQEINLTLAKMAPPRILEDKMQDDIAYLRVQGFDAGTAKQIREKLSQFEKQGAKKLILDLRDCSSGDIAEGISTAQIFVSSGTITTLKGQTVSTDAVAADAAKVAWKLPVSVLISNGTAGPAEIVASAIAGNHRGETVGERTFGTASVQKLIQLDDGAALILTVANYFTPDGKSIAAEGVAPTVEVNPFGDEATNVTDEEPSYPAPAGHAVSPTDPTVKKAIEILNGNGAPAVRKAA
jgi:carboxyl-terminal processing protease